MKGNDLQLFSQSVIEKLGYYVYILKDPRNDETFYVGKGLGNRIFSHLQCAIEFPNESDKIKVIKEIMDAGFEVQHYILRHGLTEDVALEIESAIIDFVGLANVTNQVSGHNSFSFGLKTVEEIIIQYEAKEAIITDPVLYININKKYERNMSAEELYEATRKSWVVSERRNKAKYAFSVYAGIVREVYEIDSWYKTIPNRFGFTGRIANDEIRNKYLHRSVAKHITKHSQNPIRYINC